MNKTFITFFSLMLFACLNACQNQPVNDSSMQKNQTATKIKFEDSTAKSGINFKHEPTRTEIKLLPEIMGSGLAIADFNRDGAPDIIFVNSGAVESKERPENAKNQIFINDGKGNFTNQTDKWNLTSTGYGQGVAVGDYDNDGWTDVFLTDYAGDNRLLRNTGEKFEDVTEQSGIKPDGEWATSAGFFDFDNDGDLDLYVAKYVSYSKEIQQKAFRNKLLIYPTPVSYKPIADKLWQNDGNGKFTDISEKVGLNKFPSKGLALGIGDIDLDGDQDIYVANDTEANQLWINDGKGNLKDIAQIAGCAYSEVGHEEGSMGVDFSDFDGNGLLDITVTTYQDEVTDIYSQKEPLLFYEVSDAVGVGATSRRHLKFGIDFFDADNDGDEDLIVANGHIEDNIEQNSDSITFAQSDTLYENLGNGKFTDISEFAGSALKEKRVSRGLVTADLDGDGDLDYIISNNGEPAQIAFNETTEKGNFVGLWLEGEKANLSAIGTRIVAKIGDKTIQRQIMGAQSYLSVSDFHVLFGLGKAEKIDELTIFWAGSEPQKIKDLQSGKFYYIREGKEPMPFVPGEKQMVY
jgi:hypothetical protein